MLTYDDWNEITNRISSMLAQSGQSFIQADVVKNDPDRMLVWVTECGDTPIPIVAFDYSFTNPATGLPQKVKPQCPGVGELVLIALHLGSRRLPKCLGKIQSTGWVEA